MKNRNVLFIPAVATLSLFLMGCPKTKNVVPPVDDETQSSVQASYVNYLVSDIEMLASFMGEAQEQNHFYNPVDAIQIYNTPVLSPNGGARAVSFNHQLCKDGRVRHGTIYLKYVVAPEYPNARYMRAYKFDAHIEFSGDYSVDDYNINLNVDDGGYFTIVNTLPSEAYSPASTKLTWKIDGKLKFTHLTDPRKNMTWEGHWTKTLNNTNSTLVVSSPTNAINWYKAEVSYAGTSMGTIPLANSDGVIESKTFNMKINSERPLTRDFQCTPDPILGVKNNGNNGMTATISE
ncbi:MAG: hypothetical protein JNL60_05750, partial [Bacteroidia bacterium]|nr:hypothetical protein [Bacteroidia bacterium]